MRAKHNKNTQKHFIRVYKMSLQVYLSFISVLIHARPLRSLTLMHREKTRSRSVRIIWMGRKFYNIKFENNSFTFKSMQTQDKAAKWTRQNMDKDEMVKSCGTTTGKMSLQERPIFLRTIFTLECAVPTLKHALPIIFTLECARPKTIF